MAEIGNGEVIDSEPQEERTMGTAIVGIDPHLPNYGVRQATPEAKAWPRGLVGRRWL